MKRLRDDGSSLQSSFSSGDSCSGGRGGSDQTENDGLTYLKVVKETLQDQREKYKMFLMVMKFFFARRTDASRVIAKVKELFEGHNNLISGFNIFLPKALDISEFWRAIIMIKERFQNDLTVCMIILDILNEFREGHNDINTIHNQISILLNGHADLIDEFTRFLPKTEPVSAEKWVRRVFSDLRLLRWISLEMKRLGDSGSSSQSKQLSASSRCDFYAQSQAPVDGGGTLGKVTANDGLSYLKEVMETFRDQREKYDMFCKVVKDFKNQRIGIVDVMIRVKELFEGHNNLISGFNIFLPKGYEIALEVDEAINILTNIEKRFQNDEQVYVAFSDILNEFWKGRKDVYKAYYEISILLKGHADLMDEINRFLFSKS
ncbi:paired amphipathic helix protein Sin3-like 2 [Quercus lobata]|uniref:Paired amphipathic helix protein Sin3-like 2 n=1 Tax=Quercus lobata TaxID=97700 RepID=A0A7N2L088_QUELO|nr:paired amphipathic helix protein Sin3-like 2 [Quercus lobata]XP_030956201.1 paired amphipathic helix protein Sin3-like 2 [Quercus lobata]